MKKKINFRMNVIGFFSILLTAVIITLSFYEITSKKAWSQLEDMSHIFINECDDVATLEKISESVKEHFRITLIESNGTVYYDSYADASSMSNHSKREEVVNAKADGMAKAVRDSDTIGKNTYYYAVLVGQGRVLRISEETDNIMTTFVSVIPLVLLAVTLAFILCFFLSTRLTSGLVKPIVDMAKNEGEAPYAELEPFAKSMRERREMERIKMEFTANVSHELKTPLTSISGYAELIENGMAREEDIPGFATKIHTEAGRLIVLIGDIMQLSELEDPGAMCNFTPIDLYEVVEECVSSLEIPASKRGVSFQVDSKPGLMVNGDLKLIGELVYNLCDNAIRYNKENGSVYVRIKSYDETVELSIRDTGIGIEQKNYDNVFRRFFRVDKSRSKETGGTGLGLAIVKHIAELHKARIEVESTIGVGTNITVYFQN